MVSRDDAYHRYEADGFSLPNEPSQEIDKKLERIKWYLWHGNVFMALEGRDDLAMDIEVLSGKKSVIRKLENAVSELNTYIVQNQSFIPNYLSLVRCVKGEMGMVHKWGDTFAKLAVAGNRQNIKN